MIYINMPELIGNDELIKVIEVLKQENEKLTNELSETTRQQTIAVKFLDDSYKKVKRRNTEIKRGT